MKNPFLVKLVVFVVSLLISLFAVEYAFRWMIFGKSAAFKHLRNPGLYGREMEDDYWKLYYKFDGGYRPPKSPHPLLGWVSTFDRETFVHDEIESVQNRRPVLLYGNSFARCVDTVICFQTILNGDSSFNKNHYLLNYGVGGYGVDQMYLLCSLTVHKFEKPFVVFSIMPGDMDRCLLSVRTGQKPYFELENENLVLKGIPVNDNPAEFFKEHPASISSYVYTRFLHSDLNTFISLKKEVDETKEKIKKLNEKIILQAESILKGQNIDHVFMIYDNLYYEDGSWRSEFLTTLFTEHNIPFITTSELVSKDKNFPEFVYERYIIKGEGHPTTYYNWLTCQEIKRAVFDYKGFCETTSITHKNLSDTTSVEFFERKIRLSNDWLNDIKKKAVQNNVPLDTMIRRDAVWMSEQEKKKK